VSIALTVLRDGPVFFWREGRWGKVEKLSFENMSLKHIQSTPGDSNLTFKGNRKKFKLSGARKKIAEIKVKNSSYCTVNILITFN